MASKCNRFIFTAEQWPRPLDTVLGECIRCSLRSDGSHSSTLALDQRGVIDSSVQLGMSHSYVAPSTKVAAWFVGAGHSIVAWVALIVIRVFVNAALLPIATRERMVARTGCVFAHRVVQVCPYSKGGGDPE